MTKNFIPAYKIIRLLELAWANRANGVLFMADLLKIFEERRGEKATQQAGDSVTQKNSAIFPSQYSQAQEVAQRSTLDGDVIAVVKDESVEGVPEGYPVYTEAELRKICQSRETINLMHHAKRLTGGRVEVGLNFKWLPMQFVAAYYSEFYRLAGKGGKLWNQR